MKHLLPLLVALVIGLPSRAQLGTTHFENSKNKPVKIIGGFLASNDKGFFMYDQYIRLKGMKFVLTIDFYNHQHVKQYTIEPDLEYKNADLKLITPAFLNDTITLFASCYQSKDNANYLMACHLDSKGKVLTQWTMLDTIYEKQKITPFYFGISLSPDKQQFVVDHRKIKVASDPVDISYKFFSRDFKRTKSVDFKPNLKRSDFTSLHTLIDNEGNLFVFSFETKEIGNNKKEPDIEGTFRIHKVASVEQDWEHYTINTGKDFFSGMHVDFTRDGRIFMGVMVFDAPNGELKGYLRQELDKEGLELIRPNLLPIKNELLNKEYGSMFNKKGFHEVGFNEIKYLEDEDGNAWVIAEQQVVHIYPTTVSDGNKVRFVNQRDTYDKDLFVIRLNQQQQPIWCKTIAKDQFQEENFRFIFTSYTATIKNHNLYVVFNDHKANLKPNRKAGAPIRLKKWANIQVSISEVQPNPKREIETKALFAYPTKRYWLMLNYTHALKNGDLLVIAERKEKYKPGTIKIQTKGR